MTSSGSTNTGVSEEVREATLKIIQRLFKDAKVCSFQQMRQQLRDMALEDSGSARSSGFARGAVAAANNIDVFPEALQETISKVAVHIHGIYDPVSTPDNKKIDEFRKVIIDLFRAEGPKAKLKMSTMSNATNTMSEAAKLQLAKLKMSTMSNAANTMSEAAKLQLQRDISPFKHSKVLQDLRVGQCSGWVLRNADVNPFKPTSA
ncbi:hypothetical protein ACS0TY_013045 [Phlomoides rotata]